MKAIVGSYQYADDPTRWYWFYEILQDNKLLYRRSLFGSWQLACASLRLQWALYEYRLRVGAK